jgi:hypothetical protein
VHLYTDHDDLVETVAAFLASGFNVGAPAVVVATPEHVRSIRVQLADAGWGDTGGLLVVADADATLGAIVEDGTVSAQAFDGVIGRLLDDVAARFPGQTTRVFGEMVDLLCARGDMETAVVLEELWNGALARRRFCLLCAYELDLFDRASQVGPLPHICSQHSQVQPAYDSGRLSRAVDLALEEVLGYADAGRVYFDVAGEARLERIPVAQLALMWVSANMPDLADRVLASARVRYNEPSVQAAT